MSAAVAPASRASAQDPIRVMVVDDAVVVRGLVSRWIEEEPGFKVVASLRTGREAVDQILKADPDVVILDIEMPDMDGLTALPLLLGKKKDVMIIMASTLTRRNAEVSLKALSLGAADYVPKPETNREVTTSTTFRRELVEKVRHLGAKRRRAPGARPSSFANGGLSRATVAVNEQRAAAPAPSVYGHPTNFKLRPFSPSQPKVLLIGSSTGGPQALTGLAGKIGEISSRVPILITQHMPPTFTTILAEHLARASGRPAHEPTDGEPIVPGTIYVAPGGRHMLVKKGPNGPAIQLDDGPLVNFCRPAVDPLFKTAAQVWGGNILAVILTGMGSDGSRGAQDIVAAGGNVIAQDEATSVVWGMPGAAAQAGVCSAVLPLDQIAPKIVRLFSGDRS